MSRTIPTRGELSLTTDCRRQSLYTVSPWRRQIRGALTYTPSFDISRDYDQYPNAARQTTGRALSTHSKDAPAWMVTASKVAAPFFFYGEAFSLDPDL